jgi:hypothetical protein
MAKYVGYVCSFTLPASRVAVLSGWGHANLASRWTVRTLVPVQACLAASRTALRAWTLWGRRGGDPGCRKGGAPGLGAAGFAAAAPWGARPCGGARGFPGGGSRARPLRHGRVRDRLQRGVSVSGVTPLQPATSDRRRRRHPRGGWAPRSIGAVSGAAGSDVAPWALEAESGERAGFGGAVRSSPSPRPAFGRDARRFADAG